MASNSSYQTIHNFIGSKEEAIVIRYLRLITTEAYLPPHGMCGFYNLIIKTCNADQGTCFTDAMVNLQLIDECRKAVREQYECGFPKCGFVFLKDIVDESILKLFVTGGVKSIEKYTDYQQAFLVLLQFLHDKDRHEQSIKSLITINSASGSKVTDITVAMAHHLYSQLVPGNKYKVNGHVKDIPRVCGCGCRGRISQGDTSLGSQDTWHGRVDVLLDDTIAVCVKEDDSSDEMTEDNTSSEDEDDETDEDSEEPVSKQRKLSYSDSHVEVKPTKTDVLLEQNTLNQIFAEAVTNTFAQVNVNKDKFSDFLIPTFGSTCYNVSNVSIKCKKAVYQL
ncbi:uncharacterized protein [Argopecten irradians]|uniref:uncharacterized protein n=1 Tax=Argopecten irradians TaxID=31199 RepID=UPI00371A1FF4